MKPISENALILDIETAPLSRVELIEQGLSPKGKSSEDDWTEFYRTAQLNAAHCRVCAVGIHHPEVGVCLYFSDDSHSSADRREMKLISTAFEWLLIADRVIGHASKKFDIPMLLQRAHILDIDTTKVWQHLTRGGVTLADDRVICTKERWNAGQPRGDRPFTGDSLDDLCRAFGWPTKPGKAIDFYQWDLAKREEYLRHDVETTRKLALRLGIAPSGEERRSHE